MSIDELFKEHVGDVDMFQQGKVDGANLKPCQSDHHDYLSGYSIGYEQAQKESEQCQ